MHVLRGGADARRAALHRGVYILPNLFTTAGLFLGVYALIASSRDDFLTAAVCIVVAHVCDGLDGRIARWTHTESQFGVEYDSLADLVAFGVAPGILAYRWALEPWGTWGWLAASLFVACGALRLARFNVQSALVEKRTFLGLPIPAAASMVAATVLLYYFFGGQGETSKHFVLLLMVFVFKVPIHGSVLLLLALSTIYIFALLSLGLLVSSRARTQMEAIQIAQGFLLPSIMLSGYFFPLSALPGPLRLVSKVLPATHFIAIARGIIIRGASFPDLWRSVVALIVIAAVLVGASTRAFHKTIS